MTTSGLPFDDFRRLLARLPALKGAAHGPVAPPGLGRLGALADWLALVGGRRPPRVTRPLVALYAGTHGVARHLDDAEGPEAERARVERIGTGQGPVGRLCREAGLGLRVYDLALDHPVGDITREPAMDERGCAATMAFGMEAIAGGVDLIVLGDAGGAGGVAARAVLAALGAERAALLADAAADAGAAATAALALNERHLGDPLEALRRVGGREVAALAGAVLAARIEGVPVILDGLPALAGAAVVAATAGETTALDHCRLAEAAGPAARAAAEHLALTPLVDFAIAAGEGTAGALAASLVKSAAAVATPPPAPQDGAPAG